MFLNKSITYWYETCFVQYVDVPEEVVMKACLSNGEDTVKKVSFFENV